MLEKTTQETPWKTSLQTTRKRTSTMTDSYYYYRCPCPSTECNGSVCRYPEMMPSVATSFNPPSCSFFPQERKLLSYASNVPKIEPINKHIPQPPRWTAPYTTIPERQITKQEITPRTFTSTGKKWFNINIKISSSFFFKNVKMRSHYVNILIVICIIK